jgi:uncharacterized membrane protein YkoI
LLKRILLGGGAAGALTAAYFVGSLTIGGALAQTSPTTRPATPATQPATPSTQSAAPATQPAAPAAKEAGKAAESANEASEQAALASQAKITADQAKAAALAKFPGATVGKIELDNESSVLAYDVRLTDAAGAKQEVSVDATSGTVLAAQAEAAETPGAPEGPETAD